MVIKRNKPQVQRRKLDIDVGGKDGVKGNDGYSGSRGSDGGHATRATEGEDAGDVSITLRHSDAFEGVEVSGETVEGGRRRKLEDVIGAGSSIEVDAKGGEGGEGGDGGDGGRGVDGSDGMNATRYSNGQNGEDGEDGGDGGDGTSGADGGRGGRVEINVDEADTDYLAMVDGVQTRGGRGGRGGDGGTGGAGGDGGDGGSSYSWTTTSGSGEDQKTDYHSNSGGYDGADGSRGRSGRDGSSGRTGRDGEFKINVKGEDGEVRSYDDRFRVHSSGLSATSENQDGIIEPGERVSVDLDVQNRGPMATPKANTVLGLRANELVRTNEKSAQTLDGKIQPGQGQHLSGLQFDVADKAPVGNEGRFTQRGSIDVAAEATRAGRTLDESKSSLGFNVTYPVEISPIEGDRTATLQNPAEVSWKVTNISTKPLGEDAECQRMIESYLKRVGGDAPIETLTFTNAQGQTLPLTEGIGRELKQLGPGESAEIKGSIGFKKDAPAYSSVSLRLSLALDEVNDVDVARTIQNRAFSVQLARNYAKDPDAGMLVVVNNRSSKEEIAAWEQLAGDLGTKANVWNLSLYGAVSLTDVIGDHELGKDFAGKTAVVLNNDYDGAGNKKQAARDLGEDQNLKATCASNLSTLFVGGQVDIDKRLDASRHGKDAQGHASVGEFLDDAIDADSAGVSKPLGKDVVEVYARGAPQPKDIERAVQRVAAELEDQHPDRRHNIQANFKPGPKDESFWSFLKEQKVGTLEITRSVDVNRHSVTHLDQKGMHDPSFVLSDANKYAVVKSMPFAAKLKALDAPAKDLVMKAVLSDIAEESQVLRQETWDIGFSDADAQGRLRRLTELGTHASKLEPEQVIELAANIKHMNSQATSLWDRVLPFRAADHVSDASDNLLDAMLKGAFPDKGSLKSAQTKVAARVDALEAKDDAQIDNAGSRDEKRALKQADHAMTEYLRPEGLWSNKLASGYSAWAQDPTAT